MKILTMVASVLATGVLLATAGCCSKGDCGEKACGTQICCQKGACTCDKCDCTNSQCLKDCKKAGCTCTNCTCKNAECLKDCKKANCSCQACTCKKSECLKKASPTAGAAVINLDELKGKWMLLDDPGLAADQLKRPANIAIEFDKDRVNGFSGVNRFFGPIQKDKFKFGPLASTMMAGPEENMKYEYAFNKLMGKVDGYQLRDGVLELRQGDTVVLRFSRDK